MSIINLSIEGTGVEQHTDASFNLTGDTPSDPDNASWDPARHVVTYPAEPADGGGLFDPAQVLKVDDTHAYVTHIQIVSIKGGAFTWTVDVTSGLEDGDASKIDDPARDQEIAAGSDNVHLRANVELLPQQKIRITTSGVGASDTVRAIVHFSKTHSGGGRLIA